MKSSTGREREHIAHPDSQGAKTALQPGQPFNPYGLFHGVFVPEALVRCPDLSPGAKLAYGRLVRYAGQDGRCFPRQDTLALELGVSIRQVWTYIKELTRYGLLKTTRHGLQAPNNYTFLWHAVFSGTEQKGSAGPDRKETSGQDRKETSDQDRKETSIQDRQKTSAPISRESSEDNLMNPPPAALAGVSSSSTRRNLCSTLASLAVEETSLNRTEAETVASGRRCTNPLSESRKADDDEKPVLTPTAPVTPKNTFLLRVAQRHPEIDAPACFADVHGELRKGAIPFDAFLRRDLLTTTNPKALTNPRGYYRNLAKEMVAEYQKQMAGIPTQAIVETPRCEKCNGCGYLVEHIEGQRPRQTGEFCSCKLGEDLAANERRAAKKAAKAGILYPDSVDTGVGSVSRHLPPPSRQAARTAEMLKRAAGGLT